MTRQQAPSATPWWLWPWCAFVFLVPFESLLNVANLATPLRFLGLAAAFLLAVARPGRVATLANLAVAALVFALAWSYLGSIDPATTKSGLVAIGVLWVTYVLATSTAMGQVHWLTSLRAWLWGGGAAAAMGIFDYLRGARDLDGRLTLMRGPFEADPNFVINGMVFPFAAAVFFLGRGERRAESVAAAGLILTAAVLSGSRGGMLALGLTLVVLLAASRRWKTLAVTLALVPVLYFAFLPSLGRLDFGSDLSGSRRTEIWPVGIEAGLEHPATGIGLGSFPKITASAAGLYWPRDSHNTYLQAFAEAGLPGLLGLGLAFAAHVFCRRKPGLAAPVLAGLLGTAAAGMFLHLLTYELLWVGWIVAAQAATAGAALSSPKLPARAAPASDFRAATG